MKQGKYELTSCVLLPGPWRGTIRSPIVTAFRVGVVPGCQLITGGDGCLEEFLQEVDSCPHQAVQEVQDDVVCGMQEVGKAGQDSPPLSYLGVSGSVTYGTRESIVQSFSYLSVHWSL